MNCDAITGICAVFVVVIALCVFLFCLGYRSSGDLGQELAKAMQDSIGEDDSEEYDSEEDDPEPHYGALHIVDRDGEPLESGEQSPSGDKVLDADDFLSLGLLDEEDDEEKLRNCVNRMVERTHEMLPLIVRVITELKRGFDDDFTEATFIKMKDHLWSEIQGYHDTIEAINLCIGVNSEFLDQIVEIEKALAEVEGYNL